MATLAAQIRSAAQSMALNLEEGAWKAGAISSIAEREKGGGGEEEEEEEGEEEGEGGRSS